jgi:carboxymethylenebutenolidase
MNSRWIDIPAADGGHFKGYLTLPPRGKGPGILLVQEIFGVNTHIRAVADQWAMDGYTVLAPDIFWRMQPMVDLGYDDKSFEKGFGFLQKMDFGKAVGDIAATVKALRALPECKGKVASLGFCMGGLLSYLSAAHAGVDAAVCYYGGSIPDQLGEADNIKVPVLFHFAGADDYIPMAGIEKVKEKFAGRPGTSVYVYPGVNHGFNCWERPAYDQPTAALARGRSLEFLSREL